jgi:hypothetical protein
MDRDEPHSDTSPRETAERRPDRGHRLPKLTWQRLLRPGVSGTMMIGLFLGTLLVLAAAAFFLGHQ